MENYLADVLDELIAEASQIKKEKHSQFEEGRLFAYYEIISTHLNQAEAFGIMERLPKRLQDYRAEDLIDA